MSSDPDACLPGPLRDFVFDLHDSCRRSQIASEQTVFYIGTFREITAKYFATSAWPSPEAVATDCDSDPLFLALYRELTHRHFHSISRPQVRDRIDGWHVYRNLFDLILKEAEAPSDAGLGFYVIPDWAFDILHEFVYQFQGFCQFRTTQAGNASVSAAKSGTGAPASETIDVLSRNRDAWAVETVLFYLHRLVAVGCSDEPPSEAHRLLGTFASVALSRLECLLGDYRASLKALDPVFCSGSVAEEEVNGVFSARLSLAYHSGVSYIMLRRYKDAADILGDICAHMQRGFKTGQLRKLPGSEQFQKNYDRMIALLSILSHICPSARLEDAVSKHIQDRYGNQLSKIEAGEEGYEDLFMFACPKFVNPAVPDYGNPQLSASLSQDVYKLQVKQFMQEMSQQQILRKLRSYMKLYTSISAAKLADFNDTEQEEFLSNLLCFKHKMRQLERDPAATEDKDNTYGLSLLDGKEGTALDIHYYIKKDMVHVDEAEKQRRFENYFMSQIAQSEDIMKDLANISTVV
mmetsp:Transcript_32948/g.48326  ORF Transcript_32948/g.48326 Transcript_32948/m.48326 type:complete len:521 (+) Transcript_32948:71-1633(+)